MKLFIWIITIWFLVLFMFVGCAANIGKQPKIPVDVETISEGEGNATAVTVPITISDPSFIITGLCIIGVVSIALAALFGMLWQRNSRGGRRKRIKHER